MIRPWQEKLKNCARRGLRKIKELYNDKCFRVAHQTSNETGLAVYNLVHYSSFVLAQHDTSKVRYVAERLYLTLPVGPKSKYRYSDWPSVGYTKQAYATMSVTERPADFNAVYATVTPITKATFNQVYQFVVKQATGSIHTFSGQQDLPDMEAEGIYRLITVGPL